MNLLNGENIVISSPTVSVNATFPLIGVSSTGKFFIWNAGSTNTFDLETLSNEGIVEIQFLSSKTNRVTIKGSSGDLICTSSYEAKKTGTSVIGKLYFYQNKEWRYRALDQFVGSDWDVKNKFGYSPEISVRGTSEISNSGYQPGTAVVTHAYNSIAPVPSGSTYVPQYEPEVHLQRLGQFSIPSFLNNLHIEFSWKSHTSKSGMLQKLVSSQTLNVNMDLSISLYDSSLNLIETVNSYNSRSRNSSVYHYGDKTEGLNTLGSEMASISFRNLEPSVQFISICVTSKSDHRFNLLETSKLEFKNQEGMIPLMNFSMRNEEDKPGCFVGFMKLQADNSWKFVAVEDYISRATNPSDLVQTFKGWVGLTNSI